MAERETRPRPGDNPRLTEGQAHEQVTDRRKQGMKQLTIRKTPDEVAKIIEREAKGKRKSKNKIILNFPGAGGRD